MHMCAALVCMATLHRVLGQGFSMFKEKSSAALEAAKASNAGTAVAGGLNRAAAVGSEQIGKIKETDAYKKSSSFASTQLERTSVVASGALEKVRYAQRYSLWRWPKCL